MLSTKLLPTTLVLILACVLSAPGALAGQEPGRVADSDWATVVAGEQYGAGELKETFLGRTYHDLWTTPVRMPVLRPDTLGGLTPTGLGGGFQTVSLVLQAGNGREYRFRLVEKNPGNNLPEGLKHTLVHDAIQDQTSSLNPAGALVADRILDAAGLLHASPRLYVMPDHPFLGEYRGRFAGKLGLLEERPEEDEERGITFAGADEIEGRVPPLFALVFQHARKRRSSLHPAEQSLESGCACQSCGSGRTADVHSAAAG